MALFSSITLVPIVTEQALWCIVVTCVLVLIPLYLSTSSRSDRVILNPRKPFELTYKRVRRNFMRNAIDILQEWFEKYPDGPVDINTDLGILTVLPPRLAQEVRNNDALSLPGWFSYAFNAHLAGFEAFREGTDNNRLLRNVVAKHLTKKSSRVLESLAEESYVALSELISGDHEWHEIDLKEILLCLISRTSSRIFLGPELCHNKDWLRVTREYTVIVFTAAIRLRQFPRIIRPIANMFLSYSRQARELVQEARHIIEPVILSRRAQMKACSEDAKRFDDAISWLEAETNGQGYDPAMCQLMLSIASIHTTTDLTYQTIIDMTQHPEILDPLRNEINTAISRYGWGHTALHQMKLLDSVVKESQRLTPPSKVSMQRLAMADVPLSDGTKILAGQRVALTSYRMWDSRLHSNPETWDGYRFLNMRRHHEKEHLMQLVSTGPDHPAFGYGKHACPGRFFAANEVKTAVIKFLLEYDFEPLDKSPPKVHRLGFAMSVAPGMMMRIRRRQNSA